MTRTYTAADFANARFAEHESGQAVALRWTQDYGSDPDDYWVYERPLNNRFSKEATHREMADMGGWVPVPTKPQITESRYRFMVEGMGFDFKAGFNDALGELGIKVIPDPEPTNTEKWQALVDKWQEECDSESPHISFAEWLDRKGVTAPTVKGN